MKIVVLFGILSTGSVFALAGSGVIVKLAGPVQTVKRGETPQFLVTVEAESTTVRVMKFGERDDLRHNFARLIVTKDGAAADVPRFISDPGSTRARDYTDLAQGERMSFTHDGAPFVLSKLKPGTYSAVLKLQPDWSSEAVQSNVVSFRVSEP